MVSHLAKVTMILCSELSSSLFFIMKELLEKKEYLKSKFSKEGNTAKEGALAVHNSASIIVTKGFQI